MTETILVATDLTEPALALLRADGAYTVRTVPPQIPAVRDALHDAVAVILRDDVPITRDMLEQAPHLRLIGRVGASLSGIDLDAATRKGVYVMNTPGANAIAAGEHTLTLMLALSRRLVTAHNSLKDGYWLLDRGRQAGTQLYGKTLGIIGLGRVGSIVALRALSFGMTVLAYDPYIPEDRPIEELIRLVSLKELLSRADFVSLHVPASAETRGMINAQAIQQMKRGARLINTAHGSLIDEAALSEALKQGHLAGAAVDVYAEEPPYNSPLVGDSRVIHTPRIGDNTVEAMQDLSMGIATQVLDALNDEDFRHVVNLPFSSGLDIDYDDARPSMLMAEKLGAILNVLIRQSVVRAAMQYRGESMTGLLRPVTVAFLKGLLAPSSSETVNYVNAPMIASERGIQVTQAKGLKAGDYLNLFTCQVTLEDGEQITISATLLDGREPHIVQINDYRMNFVPEGHLLIMGSFDQPGVIGRVGTMMAINGVNIASWHTGRATPGGHTLTILTLDEPMPEPLLTELRQQDFVRHAHQIRL